MKHSKISITVLTMAIFGNSVNCFAVSQRRQTLRPKHVTGQLVTPNVVVPTQTPDESVNPETPSQDNTDNDNTGNNTNDNNTDNVVDTTTDKEDKEKSELIRSIRAEYKRYLNDAQLNCINISDKLQFIKNLSTGTIAISGTGALVSGGALATEIIDGKVDENSEKFDHDKAYMAETGLLIGGSVTSAGGAVTSAIAWSNVDDLISKMKDCRSDISNIKITKAKLEAEDVDSDDKTILEMNDIISNCEGIDSKSIDNIKQIKGLLIGSTATSVAGLASGIAATITNAKYHNESDEDKKAKLSKASKITTGVSAGAQTVTLVLSIIQASKLDNDKDTADKCEDTLMKY